MITHLDYALQHQKDMRQDAEKRHLEREARKERSASRRSLALIPAGNGFFRWSDERDRAA